MSTFILSLSDLHATLEEVGGKGMSLAKLSRAGLPVPDGFHITTEAYRRFVAANDLQAKILAALGSANVDLPTTLETVSASIGRLFTDTRIPDDLAGAITRAYAELSHPQTDINQGQAVAVRSSATAEDLPEASFAGQQETYLNIRGADAVLEAVKKCWASLWTARAIAYRARQGITPDSIALAVVVQELVCADAAGVMFTANPINGRRNEMVINAAWGLGEAIVGGLVSPDTIVADKATGKVKTMEVAEKTVITATAERGTQEQVLDDERRRSRVLKEAQVAELVELARRIEDLYGKPQDIEWCLAAGRFYIVQSRPITTLGEAPIEWAPPNPKGTYMRTSIADLMPDPLSPLFISWGVPTLRDKMKPLGVRLTRSEPVLQEDYFTSINSYAYMNAGFPPKAWWWILTGLLPAYPRLLRELVPIWRDELHPEYQAIAARYRDQSPKNLSTGQLWRQAQEILDAAMYYACGLMFATMGASAGAEGLLTQVYNKVARRAGDPEATVLLMGWDNIPVRSEKSLYDIAMWAREHDELAEYLLETPTAKLAEQLSPSPLTSLPAGQGIRVRDFPEFAMRFKTHLEEYGHLLFQLDFAEPLALDRPEMLLETVKMYLHGQGTDPHLRQRASEEERIQTAESIRNRLRGLKRWAFVKALNWGQSMAEVREDALAEIGLGYPALRATLHELGGRFVTAGAFQQAGDIFWLEKDEVDRCVRNLQHGNELEDLSEHVERRKAFNKKAEQETPPPMMPMKKRVMGIKANMFIAQTEEAQAGNVLRGVPTSAGKITAPARVLRGPQDFDKMRPGEILIAGTTTPAWTPLFAMASAIVTDIGGPLSHGSIVAREYGIPAVMGTGIATRRIQSGQVVTVDGTKGEVVLETTEENRTKQPAAPLEWPLPHPKAVLARGSFAEFVPEPISPLFATLAVPIAREATLKMMGDLGMIDKDSYVFVVLNDYVYVGFIFTPKMIWKMVGATAVLTRKLIKAAQARADAEREKCLAAVHRWRSRELAALSPSELLRGATEIFGTTADYYTVAQSGAIPTSMISETTFGKFYDMLVKRKGDPDASKFVFGTENHAMRSEKALYDLAMWAKERPELESYLNHTPAEEICAAAKSGAEPMPALREFSQRFNAYLGQYGHAIYDLDFAKPVPADAPAPLVETLKVYLSGKNNPYERQRAALEFREQAAESIEKRLDPLRRKYFLKLLKWAQDTAHLRENSIADLGLGHPQIRRMLGELGKRLATSGAIACGDDVYWLELQEVEVLAAQLEKGESLKCFAGDVERRKAKWQAMRHISPPITLPKVKWMSAFFPSNEGSGRTIKGFGASAGRVTARACVMLGPEDFCKMQPGDAIVAGITTPAWTPLFARAAAIVTDIGGPLSHSSIVAREYGIPAVLATGNSTRRIKDGQTITVDGTAGTVSLA